MDWQLAITRNREALRTIIVALMASVGLVAGRTLTTLPHFLYCKALRILRKAESAVRRLIVIAAHDLTLRGFKLRQRRGSQADLARLSAMPISRAPTFNLIDPLKTFDQDAPDFTEIYADSSSAANHQRVSATSLGNRILALKLALDFIPHHAKRLARWYATRDHALAQNQPHRLSPLRPGPPPASCQQKRTEMEKVLSECHSLAIYARDRRDSS